MYSFEETPAARPKPWSGVEEMMEECHAVQSAPEDTLLPIDLKHRLEWLVRRRMFR